MYLLYPSCKKCDYYINDECYFSQEEIKKFRRGLGAYIFFNRYKCEFCATPISNIYNLMQQQFLEKNNNIKIPLLCSDCKKSIKKNTIKKKMRAIKILNSIILLSLIGGFSPVIIIGVLISTNLIQISFILILLLVFSIFLYIVTKKVIKPFQYKKKLKNYSSILLKLK
jgi:ribosomal protein L37AE/L43A